MKRWFIIGLFVMLALAACVKDPEPVVAEHSRSIEGPTRKGAFSSELSAIDSLMWQRPDSALACLLPYFDTCCAAEHDRHYAHLLLSELLYKNDYAQTNRAELQDAVVYFDSLSGIVDTRGVSLQGIGRRDASNASAQNMTPTNVFLAARAHYIYGVGYYEQDSAVPACREYLKALEIMEERFAEKELVGKKAQFMAITYTHSTGLFSDQYLHEQAIFFGKEALRYYQKYDATSWHKAWMLDDIGSNYDMMKCFDSAESYYKTASMVVGDKNSLMYRDIAAHSAYLKYETGDQTNAMIELHRLLSMAESERELLARSLCIGEIFYHEKQFDSAEVYLNKVFHGSTLIDSKKQAAEWLERICEVKNLSEEAVEYARFLVPFATENENQSLLKSQLTELYSVYNQFEIEKQHKSIKNQTNRITYVFIGLLSVLLGVFVSYQIIKRKKQSLEAQMKEEQYAHMKQQAALSDRLKHLKQTEQKALQQEEALRKLQSEFDATSKQSQQFQQAFKNRLLEIYKSSEENKLERILAEFSTAYPQGMDNLRANHPDLTETERNIVILSFLGFRTKEEAEILGLSLNTVEKYRTNIRKKAKNKPFSDLIG